ncbi:MAG: hypothetical protein ABSE06_05235 [Anaerolineaceae bacterium]
MQTRLFLWGTWLVILAVYIGFAGAWGAQTRQPYRFRTWLSVGFGLLVILPASLALPFVIYSKLLTWGAALVVSVFFYLKPAKFPGWLWESRFIFFYFGGVMFMIVAWTARADHSLAWLWLGMPAGVAGCLAIGRACRSTHRRGAE